MLGSSNIAAPPSVIVASDLEKRFGDFVAVDRVSFSIKAGEVFGFLGPNGAGKTSTMRMIACMSPLSSGSLRVLDMDATTTGPKIRSRLGVVPQDDALDTELTVMENLVIYGRYFGLSRALCRQRAAELLEFAQLEERARTRVDELSGGMRRRLTIARALISSPEVVVLDEPTTGLDPQARHLVWERLYQLKRDGITLVITTHYMDEAEQLCDRLVVMDHGRIVAEGAPRTLIERYVSREVLELRFEELSLDDIAADLSHRIGSTERLADRICLYGEDSDDLLASVQELGYKPSTTLARRASLEDVFLRLTGRSLIE